MSSKIAFSYEELDLLQQTRLFSLKSSATGKVYDFMGQLIDAIKHINDQNSYIFPEGVDTTTGKISKGENYKGLPYIVLDFPRLYTRHNILSFRVLLWWGHHWSVHWHVEGQMLNLFKKTIIKNLTHFYNKKYYVSLDGDQWNYDFSALNMYRLDSLTKEDIAQINDNMHFFRLSAKKAISRQMPERWILKRYAEMTLLFIDK
jgi:hypothetical protein